MKKVCLIIVICFAMFSPGCIYMKFYEGRAALVEDNLSKEYVKKKYGRIKVMGMNFLWKESFPSFKNSLKESLINKSDIAHHEKEKEIEIINRMKFTEKGYLGFYFSLPAPALVTCNEIDITFNDMDGETIIQDVILISKKITKYVEYTCHVSYTYTWYMKLKKPFTKENFKPGKYPVIITFPNGQTVNYQYKI